MMSAGQEKAAGGELRVAGATGHVEQVLKTTAWPDFFALWKDADLDIPILKEGKAEYAKLQ